MKRWKGLKPVIICLAVLSTAHMPVVRADVIQDLYQRLTKLTKEGKKVGLSDLGVALQGLNIPPFVVGQFGGFTFKSPSVTILPTNALPAGGKSGLEVHGIVSFKNQEVDAFARVVRMKEKDEIAKSIGVRTKGGTSVAQLTGVSDLDWIKLPSDLLLVVSSIDYTDRSDPQKSVKIKKGFNIITKWDLSGPFAKIQKFVDKALRTKSIMTQVGEPQLSVVFPTSSTQTKGIIVSGTLPMEIGVDFERLAQDNKIPGIPKPIKKITLGNLSVDINPVDQSASLQGSMFLAVTTQPDPVEFVLKGSFGPNKVKAEGYMKGMFDPAFGLAWLAFGEFGLTVEIDYAVEEITLLFGVPFTGVGMRGVMAIGSGPGRIEMTATGDIAIESKKQPTVVLEGTFNKDAQFAYLIQWLTGVANKATKGSVRSIPLKNIPVLTIKKGSGLIVSTADTKVANKEYKMGVDIGADVQIADIKGKFKFYINPDQLKLAGKGVLSDITIPGVIALSNLMAFLNVDAKDPQKTGMGGTGKVSIPKLDISADLKRFNITADKGFQADFEMKIQNLFDAVFGVNFNPQKIDEFKLSFGFKQNFVAVLAKELKKVAKEKAGDLGDEIRKLSGELEKTKKSTAYANYKATMEYNRQVERFNAQVRRCKKDISLTNPVPNSCLKVLEEAGLTGIEGLKKLGTKALKEITTAMKDAADAVNNANRALGITKTLQNVMNEMAKVFAEVAAGAIKAVNVKEISGLISAKDLKAGKLPVLKRFNAEINVPKPIDKKFVIDLKDINITLNFKNIGKAVEGLALKVIKEFERQIAGQAGQKPIRKLTPKEEKMIQEQLKKSVPPALRKALGA